MFQCRSFWKCSASQSSNSGWLGISPALPKSSRVSTRPVPNSCSQVRFTATRAVKRLAGLEEPVRQGQPVARRVGRQLGKQRGRVGHKVGADLGQEAAALEFQGLALLISRPAPTITGRGTPGMSCNGARSAAPASHTAFAICRRVAPAPSSADRCWPTRAGAAAPPMGGIDQLGLGQLQLQTGAGRQRAGARQEPPPPSGCGTGWDRPCKPLLVGQPRRAASPARAWPCIAQHARRYCLRSMRCRSESGASRRERSDAWLRPCRPRSPPRRRCG